MTTLTTMEGEMVLLAMLPEDRMMLVQMPRLRTIADFEDFIVDEYSRVFPHAPALSRDLRIQKCMSPELLLDRRSYTTVHQQVPNSFVDLAKNVQVGNVFHNMEQIYIVLNKKSTKHKQQASKKITVEASQKQQLPQQLPIVGSNGQVKSGAGSKQKKQATKKVTAVTPVVEVNNESNKTAKKEAQDGKKEQQMLKKPAVEKKPQDTKQKASGDVTKVATEEIRDTMNESNDAKKIVVAESIEKKVEEKSTKAAKKEKLDAKKSAKKENKSDSKNSVAKTEENTSKKAPKKTAPRKSENALLKQMLAAKHNASQSGAALVVDSLQNTESDAPQVPSKSERKRKINEEDVSSAEGNSASDALEPVTKKKKTVKKSDAKMSKPVEDEVAVAKAEKSAKKTAAQDKIQKTTKKKATATTKSQLKTDEESSTASESTPANRKLKKKMDSKSDDVEEPVLKRAKTEVLPKASSVKKVAKKAKLTAKPATPETDTSASPSSQSSSSPSTQADELASGEEAEVVETPAAKKATTVKSNKKPKEISERKSGFQKVMVDTMKRIADEKKARDDELVTTATPEKGSMQTSKSAESTASESSSDSDQPPVVVKVAKRSRKNVTPVESSSSSSDEAEELDYSQSLLADLIKNDTDEVVPVVLKKGKKSKQIDWRDDSTVQTSQNMEQSHDMPSSRLTQKSQESNSVLLPSLSRKRFSLGSMPVAKLKKSSKNPFSSPKKGEGQR